MSHWIWAIKCPTYFFKVFIEFITIVLIFFFFWFFGPEACGILVPSPGIEPVPSALEGEVLSTGPSGKSPVVFILTASITVGEMEETNFWV